MAPKAAIRQLRALAAEGLQGLGFRVQRVQGLGLRGFRV